MDKYFRLMCALKITVENMQVLHRNLKCPSFFADHPVLGGFYEAIQEMLDDVIEVGLALGKKEPTFVDAINSKVCVLIPVKDRDANESFLIAYDNHVKLIKMMKECETTVPPFVANKLQEYEMALFKTADYMLARAKK